MGARRFRLNCRGNVGGGGWAVERLESRRLLAAGALDLDFSFDGKVITDYVGQYDNGTAVAVQPDRNIVVAALLTDANGFDYWGAIRYLGSGPNAGELDTTFGPAGTGFALTPLRGVPTSIAIQSDGKIVIGGKSSGPSNQDFALLRLTGSGRLDPTFGTIVSGTTRAGFVRTDFGARDDYLQGIALQTDGKIVAAGQTQALGVAAGTDSDFALARFNSDGTPDNTFSPGGADGDGKLRLDMGGFDRALSVVVQPNGRIVAAGFGTDAGKLTVALARVTTVGVLDGNFDADGRAYVPTPAASGAGRLALAPDGKLITLATLDGLSPYAFLSRLNPDGSPAPFDNGGAPTNVLKVLDGAQGIGPGGLVIQPDGKILASAYYYSTAAAPKNGFAVLRRKADGGVDSDFNGNGDPVYLAFAPGPAVDRQSYSNDLALGSDGKIVAVGVTDAGGGVSNVAVARFDNDLLAPYRGAPFAVGEQIEAEDYNNGGPNVAYVDTDPENLGNAGYRTREGVDVYNIPPTLGGGRVVGEEAMEYLTYFFETTAADANYTLQAKLGGFGDAELQAVIFPLGVPPSGGGTQFLFTRLTVPSTFNGPLVVRDFDESFRLPAGRHLMYVSVNSGPNEPGTPAGGIGATLDWFKVVADVTPPQVTFSTFEYFAAPPRVRVQFSEDVTASVAAGDLTVRNAATGVVYTATAVTTDTRFPEAVFTLPANLPDGNYVATLSSAGVTDFNGNPLDGNADGVGGDPYTFSFFHLPGDLNRDRTVNFNDLVPLAQNYNAPGTKSYSQGDFTGDGHVDFNDLVVLAQRYNTTLPAAGAPAAMAMAPALMAKASVRDDLKTLLTGPATVKPVVRKASIFGVRRLPSRR